MTILSPSAESSAILAAAVEVAGDYGLDLIDGELRTDSGALFPPDTFVTIVHARLAADWDEGLHPREKGKFTSKDLPPKPRPESITATGARAYPESLAPNLASFGIDDMIEAMPNEFPLLGTNDLGFHDLNDEEMLNLQDYGGGAVAALREMNTEFPEVVKTLNEFDVVNTIEGGQYAGVVQVRSQSGVVMKLAADTMTSERDVYGTTVHEFGHVAMIHAFGTIDASAAVGDLPSPSQYGDTDTIERGAEIFAAGYLGVPMEPESQKFYDDVLVPKLQGPPSTGRRAAADEVIEGQPDDFATESVKDLWQAVGTRTAASEREYVRDERGRFGEGDGAPVDSAGGHVRGEKQDGTAVKFPKGTTLYRSVNADLRGALVPSRMGESGPGVYLTTNRAFAEQMTANMPGRELYEVTTGRALRLLDRTAPGGDDEYRALQDASSAINKDGALAKAITDAGYDGVRFAGVNKGDAEVTVLDASALDGKPVKPRTAAFDESAHPRDERGRFGEGDGGLADKNDTHFTTAADVSLVQWAQQFPKGTVFRSGSPARLDAMRHGEDLGTPDPTGARGETYGEERIGGIWVSTTAKPEYLDKGEVLAAFDPSKSKVVNEGAPGDMLLDHVPAGRLLGTWTPGPDGARGYDVTPPQARGRGMIRGVAPIGKAVTASFDEDLHPRDERGRFGDKGDTPDTSTQGSNPKDEPPPPEIPRDANGKLDVDALLAQNPQQPDEDIFVYQGRIAHMLDDSQEQSDLLFAVRERYEPVASVVEGMQQWQADHGLDPVPADIVEEHADLAEADAAGRAFENAVDQAGDPRVEAAYEDFKRQNEEMFDFMTRPTSEGGMGITVEFTNKKDPYPTAAAQAEDLRNNNRIVIESGLGGNHTASMTTAEYDRFRAVHDTFGHAAIGGGFDRHGEYEAWLTHSMMYTPPGRDAMSTEYHGVNSAMWSGSPTDPGGTGKTVLLGEYATPPWERTKAAAMQAAALWVTPPEIAELIARVGFDANFANHFMPCRWHYDELPMQGAAFDEDQHPRDSHGRFTSGDDDGSDVAPLVLARQRQPEDTKPGSAPARNAETLTLADMTPAQQAAVMAKVTGPIPPVKPPEGWPKDANGEKMIPQPPEGEKWGIDATPEEVRANYEAMFERGMADPENREAGMHWYENTHDQANELGDKYGYDLEQSATAIAAMSAGTRWETEFPILETMMRMDGTDLDVSTERLTTINDKLEKLGEDPVSNGMNLSDMNSAQAIQVMFNEHMTQPSDPDRLYDTKDGWGARYSFNQYERSLEAIRGELPPEEMNGVKVREFYNNITNPMVDGHVTIDVMMMQIASADTHVQNETRITGAPSIDGAALGPSPFLADEVRRIAEKNGVLAQQAQAVMWVQWLDEQKAAGRGGARGGPGE